MLWARGLRILGRNFRTRFGEIDIVAVDGRTVCFVEVRARRPGALVDPIESIDRRKRRRVELAAQAWLSLHAQDDRPIRFDVAAVVGNEIRYLEGAWNRGS